MGSKNGTSKPNHPTTKVRPRSYQPTRAELRELIKINTTPEKLAKSVLRQVRVVEDESA